jgi:hypothetical protein
MKPSEYAMWRDAVERAMRGQAASRDAQQAQAWQAQQAHAYAAAQATGPVSRMTDHFSTLELVALRRHSVTAVKRGNLYVVR